MTPFPGTAETGSAQTPLADRLVGSWTLVDYRTTDDSGRVHHPLGVGALGLLIYSADGFMSAQLMSADRAEFRTGNVHGGEPGERAEAAAGYLSYSGPYSVNEETAQVRHLVSVSLFPNWIGSDQFRAAVCEEDTLVLSSEPLVFRTTTLLPSLSWQRAS